MIKNGHLAGASTIRESGLTLHTTCFHQTGSGGIGIKNKANKPKSKCAAPKYVEPIIKKIEGKSFKCNPTTKRSNTQSKYMLIFKTHETDKRTTV